MAKETVPVERVRLGKETVTEDQEISETLRKEQIDDPDAGDSRPPARAADGCPPETTRYRCCAQDQPHHRVCFTWEERS